jgi:hypothetical protein
VEIYGRVRRAVRVQGRSQRALALSQSPWLPVDYFYSAAKHRSCGALWPIFAPALIDGSHRSYSPICDGLDFVWCEMKIHIEAMALQCWPEVDSHCAGSPHLTYRQRF